MAALQKTSMDTRNIPRKTEETEESGERNAAGIDGVVEMEKVDFTSRIDKIEDRKNDGNKYKGLLSSEEYNRRRQHVNATTDERDYARKKAGAIFEKEEKKKAKEEEARLERLATKKNALQAELNSAAKDKKADTTEGPKRKKQKKGNKAPVLSFDNDDEDNGETDE
mmetsp:Transcript_7857/g.13564  ORF Transcript_7857/g.13564 Transcript_7857/m.13564 type:complete len:167 (+) Transcript_7857:266-766(+)|eukprot:CAMPEP_0198213562 /NCGR_PEP_ID=MMETSP1445-20131203/28938_1 /TAXON_ID=36898 /ORGANISM="Pyramimonas sp., Strain CCMP2087" /LENGTH=166 /DNA_ID=CAMNT_0043888221 /DNA_START=243 /DNA_END=743 /DNA_ORIENTATION=-